MTAMWFIGVCDDGVRGAISESSVVGIASANGRISLCEEGKDPNVFDLATVRCVNSSEMLRFMRGEEVKP